MNYPSGSFNSGNIAQELDIIEQQGIEYLRVFSNFYSYACDRETHTGNMKTFAGMLNERNIQMIMVLFDGVGSEFNSQGQFYSPWYDLYGATATNSWSVTGVRNTGIWDGLATGDQGGSSLLSPHAYSIVSGSSIGDLHPAAGRGGWINTPGAVYVATRTGDGYELPGSYPDYPSQPDASGFFQLMVDYVSDCIDMVTGGHPQVLHSVDIWNEQDAAYDYHLADPGFLAGTPVSILLEFLTRWPNTQLECIDKFTRYKGWFTDYIINNHSGVPTTWGSLTPLNWALADAIQSQNYNISDYFSTHTYGFGPYLEENFRTLSGTTNDFFQSLTAPYPTGIPRRPVVYNEHWRSDANGDESLKWGLHYGNKYGVGIVFWGYFYTPGFNVGVDSVTFNKTPEEFFWFSGNVPQYDVYPGLGLYIMDYDPDSASVIAYPRNQDLISYISGWVNGYAPEPSRYYVKGPTWVEPGKTYRYRIMDQNDNPFVMPSGGKVHWISQRKTWYSGLNPQWNDELGKFGTATTMNYQPSLMPDFAGWDMEIYPAIGRYVIGSGNLVEGFVSDSTEQSFTIPTGFVEQDMLIQAFITNTGIYHPDEIRTQYVWHGDPIRLRAKSFIEVNWYESFYTSSDDKEWSGGPIGERLLSTNRFKDLGDMLSSRQGQNPKRYYRKVFVKNNSNTPLIDTRIYLENVDLTGQIGIAAAVDVNDGTYHLDVIPTGYVVNDFQYVTGYDDGISIGNVNAYDNVGIWIQFTLNDETVFGLNKTQRDASFKISMEGSR